MNREEKVVVIDYGIFLHRSIFAWRKNKKIPPEYICLQMVLACLRRIGLEPWDTVIIAVDGRHSWRKDVEKVYKQDRKGFRDKFTDIPWQEFYNRFDDLLKDLGVSTDWHYIKIKHIEADDIMAVASRYYDKEVVLVTYDSDLQQCWHYDNVKIFSPLCKPKRYKVPPKNFNAYDLISKKVYKEEADNLKSQVLTKGDYEKRRMVIDLLNLPSFVENKIKKELDKIKPKDDYNKDRFPFPNSLRKQFKKLYNDKDKVITYEKSKEIKKK